MMGPLNAGIGDSPAATIYGWRETCEVTAIQFCGWPLMLSADALSSHYDAHRFHQFAVGHKQSAVCTDNLRWEQNFKPAAVTTTTQHPRCIYRVAPKICTLFFVRLTFIKYWTNFQTYFTVKIRKAFVLSKNPITATQVCRYTNLWHVKSLTSNKWKQDFCNNTF